MDGWIYKRLNWMQKTKYENIQKGERVYKAKNKGV